MLRCDWPRCFSHGRRMRVRVASEKMKIYLEEAITSYLYIFKDRVKFWDFYVIWQARYNIFVFHSQQSGFSLLCIYSQRESWKSFPSCYCYMGQYCACECSVCRRSPVDSICCLEYVDGWICYELGVQQVPVIILSGFESQCLKIAYLL